MTDKLVCPKCKSEFVAFLAIGEHNPYMFGCGACFHRWGDVTEELKVIEYKLAGTPTPAPNERGIND